MARATSAVAEIEDIPGVRELWQQTLGDPDVVIGLVEGLPDLAHPCFAGSGLGVLEPDWLPAVEVEDPYVEHATFVASMLFGRHDSPVRGLAPRCRGLVVPALRNEATSLDPLNATRSIDALVSAGADVIQFSGAHPTLSGDTSDFFKRAIRQAAQAGVLLVVPAGNNYNENENIPAVLPEVLAVGAFDHDGTMFKFSNWGPQYHDHGITAPGDRLRAAWPGGGTAVHKGTSIAAPIVTGVVALLASLRRKHGLAASPLAVRDALVDSAARCAPEQAHGEPERCLTGQLDVPAATRLVLSRCSVGGSVRTSAATGRDTGTDAVRRAGKRSAAPARRRRQLVYALGELGYDFDSETRRDWFAEAIRRRLGLAFSDPYDTKQMIRYLMLVPEAAKDLTWVLHHLDDGPGYALRPGGPYADEVYRQLVLLLAAQSEEVAVRPFEAAEHRPSNGGRAGQAQPAGRTAAAGPPVRTIERVAVPGHLVHRTATLLSGQLVPVVQIAYKRGLCGWNVDHLIKAAIDAAGLDDVTAGGERGQLEALLRQFLDRIYFDARSLGRAPADRALNFAATNPIQAVRAMASSMAVGMTLESVDVEKSPYCRIGSECWEIKLRCVDPDDDDRAFKVYRYTIDVSDVVPVTLGEVKAWWESRADVQSDAVPPVAEAARKLPAPDR
ncbi:S8 family serine peptidase [Saccharopolyspora sp. NPDC002686]|uniref:cyanobactin maturation protease PatG family protein n=1 Tax=Saccharopolyspora sp. NPDC002686 TaxID=3154541 RepID=UPI00332329FB